MLCDTNYEIRDLSEEEVMLVSGGELSTGEGLAVVGLFATGVGIGIAIALIYPPASDRGNQRSPRLDSNGTPVGRAGAI